MIPFPRKPFFRQHGHANFFAGLFKAKPTAPAPQNQPGQPVKQQDGSFMLNGKKVKQDANDPTKWNEDTVDDNDPNKKSTNPLDNFKDLFKIDATGGDKDKAPSFQLDPEGVKKLVGSLDFAQHVTPELAAKFQSGDQAAIKEAMNSLGQSVYSTLFQHMPALTDSYVNSRLQHECHGL